LPLRAHATLRRASGLPHPLLLPSPHAHKLSRGAGPLTLLLCCSLAPVPSPPCERVARQKSACGGLPPPLGLASPVCGVSRRSAALGCAAARHAATRVFIPANSPSAVRQWAWQGPGLVQKTTRPPRRNSGLKPPRLCCPKRRPSSAPAS